MLMRLRRLLRPAAQPSPQVDTNDPRHPINAGWYRLDLPEGQRRVRFRVTIPDGPKAVALRAALTNREFMGGFQ